MWFVPQIVNKAIGVNPKPFKVDQRAVIQLLTAEGWRPVDIPRRMYGDKCVSKDNSDEKKKKLSRDTDYTLTKLPRDPGSTPMQTSWPR